MEKGSVRKIWKKAFWGCCAAAILLLLPGLVLTLSMPVYLALGIAAAVVFVVGLVLAVRGLSCPSAKRRSITRLCGRRRASPSPAPSAAVP